MKKYIFVTLCFVISCASAQKNALFIGNSYIYTNDLPAMIADMASSTNDKISYSSNTPGGCTFRQHCLNGSMDLIRQGGWDVVVLQEQSQFPSFPLWQVEEDVYPYAEMLVDSIYAYSDCPEPMFFMTWGRKNGDAVNAEIYPPLGTYEGMDSLLRERYIYMGNAFHASVCPAGKVWYYLRHNHKSIELYSKDESHPSVAGTYAAACAFYTMIFEKDPTLVSYNSSLDTATARVIREAARTVVYDSLYVWKRKMPVAAFTYQNVGNATVSFRAQTDSVDNWEWYFGDDSSCYGETVIHTFPANGTYEVMLTVTRHCLKDSVVVNVEINDSVSTNDIYVTDDETNEAENVRIVDAAGRVVYQGRRMYAPFSSLPAGVYFVNRKKVVIGLRNR